MKKKNTGNTHNHFQPLIWDKKLLSPVWIEEDSIVGGKHMNDDYISKTKKWDPMVYRQNGISKIRSVSENPKHMATVISQ